MGTAAKRNSDSYFAALQPLDAPKAAKNGVRLKTMETAPLSADIVANVPANA